MEDEILNKYIADSPEVMKPDVKHLVNSMSVIGSVTVIGNGKNDVKNFVNKSVAGEPKCVSGEENSVVQIDESKEQVKNNFKQFDKLNGSNEIGNDSNENPSKHKEKENDNEYDNMIELLNNVMNGEDDEVPSDPLLYDAPSSNNSDENNEEQFSDKISNAVEENDNKEKNESSNLSKHLIKVTSENEIFESSSTVDVNVNSNSDKKTNYTKKIILNNNMDGGEIGETGIDMDDINECPMDIEESGVGVIYSTSNVNKGITVSSNGNQVKCSMENEIADCKKLNASRDACNKTDKKNFHNDGDGKNNCGVVDELEFIDLDSLKDGKIL